MLINKSDFVQQLVDKYGYTKGSASTLVDDFLELLTEDMAEGMSVSFYGFGRFGVIEHGGGNCRNPKTGEPCDTASYYITRFYPGQGMKLAARKCGDLWKSRRRAV